VTKVSKHPPPILQLVGDELYGNVEDETAKSLLLCKIVCQSCLPQVVTRLSIPSMSRGPSTPLRILNFATPPVGKIG